MGDSSVVTIALVVMTFVLHQTQVGCYYQNNPIYQGNWVNDASRLPYYTDNCPFLTSAFSCQKNGRPNNDYLKFRWQPTSTVLSRFNAVDFLRRFRGKRIMFVGDSLSLNQWISLACMIHAAVPQARYTNVRVKGLSTITFTDYNLSLLQSSSAFFVDIFTNARGKRVMNLNSFSSGRLWKTADVLVFDSWHWWFHSGIKQAGSKWGVNGKTCAGQVMPFFGSKYPRGPTPGEPVLERVLRSMSKPVYLLDISFLSQLRKDGHPSIYGYGGRRSSDCSHWCLPGVPDVWNELLYAALLKA